MSTLHVHIKMFMAGVQRDDFLKIAPQTPLQDNALIAIRAMQESGIDVSVTSINWSAEWLQIVLGDRSAIATKHVYT